MAITVTGTGTMTAGTATDWTVPLPSTLDYGQTVLQFIVGENAATAITPSANWALNTSGVASGVGGPRMSVVQELTNLTSLATLLNADDQASATVTSTGSGSLKRNGASIAFEGGYIRSHSRVWINSISAGASATTSSGNNLTGTKNGLSHRTTPYAQIGDKVLVFLCCSRFNTAPTLNTGGTLSLSNCTQELWHPGDASTNAGIAIWSADVGANANAVAAHISIFNPAGAAGGYIGFVYVLSPHVNNPQEGAGGDRIRISVIGDSITHGSAFYGLDLAGETIGTGPERWIDRLFGNQSDAVGANLEWGNTHPGAGNIATGSTDTNQIIWYNGSYTTYDTVNTTLVRIRNMGQAGADTFTHIREQRNNTVANREDSGESADLLIICLGANDEKTGIIDATEFRDNIYALATAYNPAPRVLLVKEWAWAHDYVEGDTFTRLDLHTAYHAAIDAAATLIAGTGREVVVVDTNVDAVTSGGTNIATQTATTSRNGAIGPSPSVGVDNIHPNASYSDLTWRATIQTGLDQFDILNPSSPPVTGDKFPTIPSLPSLPSIPASGA